MSTAQKIIYNTSFLYIKLLVVLILGLISTRFVLDSLGVEQYGVYILVAGVVGMLGILNGAMSNASMRFMAFSLGSGDIEKSIKTFNTTLYLHLIIGVSLIILMEIGGIFMFNSVLNIPDDMLSSAQVVFHFMVATTFISIISVPYDAIINAHENLIFLSIVDIVGSVLKLLVAVFLVHSPFDLLITFGFLMFFIQLLQRIIKQIYTRMNYKECTVNFKNFNDKALAKEIMGFSLWNLFGSIASMVVLQVRSIFFNRYFGVTLNAADGIANNVSSQVNMVSVSLTRAINPQLNKSEGAGNRDRMLEITIISTKYSIFLFSLIALPIYFEIEYLLELWLKEVPDFVVSFCQWILIILFIEKFTFEITNAIRAVGKIRRFQLIETSITLLTIPFMVLLLGLGYQPEVVFHIFLVLSIVAGVNRLFIGKRITNLDIASFLTNGVLKVITPFLIVLALAVLNQHYIERGILHLSINFFILSPFFAILFWLLGMSQNEKDKIIEIIVLVRKKIRRKND